MKIRLALLVIVASVCASHRAARACGGGVVTTTQAATLGADAQRIFISVHGGVTDVITQIGVPATTADYGVVIPVPSQPTLDATPVKQAELDSLFSATQPSILSQSGGDDGIGCGCPVAAGSDKGGAGAAPGGVQVSNPVAIGPVTAVTLTANNGDAINAWLADNGFAIPAAERPVVDAYAGPGRYFIAIRRNDTAATGGATSVGVHFTLAGDERGLPLRFAHIGAGPQVGFTVLVVSDAAVAPSAPFAALTLSDLSLATISGPGYAAALATAIAEHGDRAFVIEGVWAATDFTRSRIDSLRPFIPAGARVTRLSTVVPATALDTDVVFDQPFTGTAPRVLYVLRAPPPAGHPKLAFGFALLAIVAIARRGPRR